MIQFELLSYSLQGAAQFSGEGEKRTVTQNINAQFKADNNPYVDPKNPSKDLTWDRSVTPAPVFLYSELPNAEEILLKAAQLWLENTFPNIK